MASTSETGHARNVANFEKLISICTGYGPDYNPAKASLKITALQTVLDTSRTCLMDVNTKMAAYKQAVGVRQTCFNGLKSLSTRILNALIASDAPDKAKEDCKSINRKIQGARLDSGKSAGADPAAAASAEPETRTVSTSRQSYDLLAEHFSALITLLEAEPEYKPNETALQVATLKTLYAEMQQANSASAVAGNNLDKARILRNDAMYKEKSGLCDLALEVKSYAKSVFGATSPQYKQISGLQFARR